MLNRKPKNRRMIRIRPNPLWNRWTAAPIQPPRRRAQGPSHDVATLQAGIGRPLLPYRHGFYGETAAVAPPASRNAKKRSMAFAIAVAVRRRQPSDSRDSTSRAFE